MKRANNRPFEKGKNMQGVITRDNEGILTYGFNTEYGQISICDGMAYFHKDDFESEIIYPPEENYTGYFNDQWGRKFVVRSFRTILPSKTHNHNLVELQEIRPVTLGEIRY